MNLQAELHERLTRLRAAGLTTGRFAGDLGSVAVLTSEVLCNHEGYGDEKDKGVHLRLLSRYESTSNGWILRYVVELLRRNRFIRLLLGLTQRFLDWMQISRRTLVNSHEFSKYAVEIFRLALAQSAACL